MNSIPDGTLRACTESCYCKEYQCPYNYEGSCTVEKDRAEGAQIPCYGENV